MLRWLADAGLILLYPLAYGYLLAKRRTPVYAATPTGAPRSARA
jgi:hypothetical protein